MASVKSWLTVGAYNLLLLVVLLEVVSCLTALTGFRGLNHYTSYYLAIVNRARAKPLMRRGQWYTEFEDWGTWHSPSAVTRHSSACFSATYRANAYGARDRGRPLQSDESRTVFLGDSFIEGWGVNEQERLTEKLEAQLSSPVLNFGVAFHTGPLQYEILYRQLASDFSHDRVIVGLLPANDFTDNDKQYWRKERGSEFQTRYRPYYQSDRNDSPFYPTSKPAENRQFEANDLRRAGVDRFLYNNTWSYYTFRHLGQLQARKASITRDYSGYQDAEMRQIQPVLSSLEKIRKTAQTKGATLTLVLIPAIDDFMRQTSEAPLTIQPVFRKFAAQQGIQLIDLLEEMPKIEPDYASYYHTCDRHWSAYGNQVAAEAIASQIGAED